jgi:hypothetical protein
VSNPFTIEGSLREAHAERLSAAAAAARTSFTTPTFVADGLDAAAAIATAPGSEPVLAALVYLADNAFVTRARGHAPNVGEFTPTDSPTFARDLTAAARVIGNDVVWKGFDDNPERAVSKLLWSIAAEHERVGVPGPILGMAGRLAQAMLAHPTELSYPTQCGLALAYTQTPDAGIGMSTWKYEADGVRFEVFDGYSDTATDISGWRHSAEKGWEFALRPFDVTQRQDKDKAKAGEIEWHPAGPLAWPSIGLFIDMALARIAEHPRTSAVQA